MNYSLNVIFILRKYKLYDFNFIFFKIIYFNPQIYHVRNFDPTV